MASTVKAVINRQVDLAELSVLAERLETTTDELRKSIVAPEPLKKAPVFTSAQVAELCGIDRNRFNYLATREGSSLPSGTGTGQRRSRMFTLPEAREWVKQVADLPKSPLLSGKPGKGKVLLSTQLKGGSCKTMTAMNIAQGLSLRGRKVLVIDLDPQASITELCGVLAYMQLSVDDTVLNSVLDPQNFHLKDVVLETYWDGIDVIPAHPGLFSAEFHLPAMTNTDNKFRFWAQMRLAVEPLREHYDYIVVDTAPSLSYLTINGLMAADALIMPLVPESIDFMSSVSFWGLFADMAETFLARGEQKKYDFISVLLSKVDNVPNGPTSSVRSWAQSAYGDWMQMIEIPKSSVVGASGLALSTVFDMSKGVVPERSLDRIRDPLVAYCKWLDEQYTDHWEAT